MSVTVVSVLQAILRFFLCPNLTRINQDRNNFFLNLTSETTYPNDFLLKTSESNNIQNLNNFYFTCGM